LQSKEVVEGTCFLFFATLTVKSEQGMPMPEEMSAREAILNRIHAATGAGSAAAYEGQYMAIERAYQQAATMDRAAILKTLIERLHEYDAHVVETTVDAIASTIREVLTSHNQKSTAVADNFPKQLLPAGFSWQHELSTTTEQLNTIEGAISGCEAAIAHTGTIILKGARTLTLLPDRLLCVVYENQVFETVPEAIAALARDAAEPLTFISGPSATADIEMTRIRGVHGPRFLDVILVRN
jgi:L-lactate dehydrogenase complex protein LldG